MSTKVDVQAELLKAETKLEHNVPRKRRFKLKGGRRANATPEQFRDDYATLMAPPKDTMAATGWVYEALSVSAYHVVRDPDLSEKERRKELRDTARAMASLQDRNALYRAEKAVMDYRAKLDTKATKGKEMERAPEISSADSSSDDVERI